MNPVMRFILLFLFILLPDLASAQSLSSIKTSQSSHGPIIEFTSGDYILADGLDVPAAGWKRMATPKYYRINETGWRTGDYHTLVGRFRFQRGALNKTPLALYTNSTRNEFALFVNGEEVSRNYAHVSDQILAWYRPYLIPLPSDSLKPGVNEIVLHVVSQDTVGVGRVIVGPNAALQDYYQSQYFWQITAPMAANFAMLILGGLAFLLWLMRRQETELLWLAASCMVWYLRNYQYFAEFTPFNITVFNAVVVYATYFAAITTTAFYLHFAKLPHRGRIIAGLFLLGIPLCLIHALFSTSNIIFYLPVTALSFALAILGLFDFWRHRNIEHGVLAIAILAIPVAAVYDVLLSGSGRGWNGSEFYLGVFGGFVYCLGFLISFGKRAVDAFADLGAANITLERRIEETRAELAASEAARQELIVGQALASERERLMQEMHDGIGSNLITALAVARQQKQPTSTIKTLNRALGDLKITVDSLEPIEGDLVALIGNLRHRMAGDLRDAGVVCKWDAKPCGPLPWLDAGNSLHVLRIFQEAIGNVLTHSGASEMRIGCTEKERDGVAGIAAYVADNGSGFDPALDVPGKGLSNIRSRAHSLHGALDYETQFGAGTIITLWLPYARKARTPIASAPA